MSKAPDSSTHTVGDKNSEYHFAKCCWCFCAFVSIVLSVSSLTLTSLCHYSSDMFSSFKTSVQFSSVAQSCPTLCDPMNRSTPGLPVHHYLPEFTQTHVYRVSDAIQPSHPLLSPSSPAPNPSQHQGFSNESTLSMRWPKYWCFSFSISPSNEHQRLVSFRMDWLDLLAVQGTLRVFSNTTGILW